MCAPRVTVGHYKNDSLIKNGLGVNKNENEFSLKNPSFMMPVASQIAWNAPQYQLIMMAGNEIIRTSMINAMKSVSNRRIWCVDIIPVGLVFLCQYVQYISFH